MNSVEVDCILLTDFLGNILHFLLSPRAQLGNCLMLIPAVDSTLNWMSWVVISYLSHACHGYSSSIMSLVGLFWVLRDKWELWSSPLKGWGEEELKHSCREGNFEIPSLGNEHPQHILFLTLQNHPWETARHRGSHLVQGPQCRQITSCFLWVFILFQSLFSLSLPLNQCPLFSLNLPLCKLLWLSLLEKPFWTPSS